MNIIQKPSPNFSDRKGYTPQIFCIHIMAGSLSGTDSWFANPASQVSAHFGIGFKGEVHQYVDIMKSAWANGRVDKPTFKLYKPNVNPNYYTLSFENEGQDLSKAPPEQLQALVSLLKRFSIEYGIPLDRDHILGHYEIYSLKPNCPATDKSIIDKIVSMCQTNEEVPILVPKDKLQKIRDYLLHL